MSQLLLSALAAALCAFFSFSPAQAQNSQGMLNLFGGMVGAAIVQSTRAEWSRLPPDELDCIQASVAQQGSSVEHLIQNGIQPSDPRISRVRSACENIVFRELRTNIECQMDTSAGRVTSFCDEDYARNIGQGKVQRVSKSEAFVAARGGQIPLTALFERADAHSRREQMQMTASDITKVPSPNFNCAKAKSETELAVCRSYTLSILDSEYGELYRRSTSFDRSGAMKKEVHTIWVRGNACEGETTCIETNLNHGIAYLAGFLRQNGQTVQTNSERSEAERKQAEAAAAAEQAKEDAEATARQARDLEEAKAHAAQAAADRAKQEAERTRVETEQKIALEKFRAEQAQKTADAELQRKREQAELEFRDLVHKTFGFAFPILGCALLGTIFFIAIRRRTKQDAESDEAKDNG